MAQVYKQGTEVNAYKELGQQTPYGEICVLRSQDWL